MVKNVLLVDDEKKLLDSMANRLTLLGFVPFKAGTGEEAIAYAMRNRPDLAIVDLKMPGMDGLVTIAKLKELYPDLKTVLLTGYGNEKIKQATEALDAAYVRKEEMSGLWTLIKELKRSGNTIVIKPTGDESTATDGLSNIEVVTRDNRNKNELSDAFENDSDTVSVYPGTPRMIGETQPMQELRKNIERLAALDCTVILRGETGTGKELAARAIHSMSNRKDKRFLAINCGCFSNESLIEELFANDKNSIKNNRFTKSIFGDDAPGTILLDQIEDMPKKIQVQLLRMFDGDPVYSENFGGLSSDMRVLAATHDDLRKKVEQGAFREDLYYRLNVFELSIPPLRERRDDIPPLCSYFIRKFSRDFHKSVIEAEDKVIAAFMDYSFPGNVRELEHIVERAVILADNKVIRMKHLPGRFQRILPAPPVKNDKHFPTLAEMEEAHIEKALEVANGNKSKAAELLGISRAALWRKLKLNKES